MLFKKKKKSQCEIKSPFIGKTIALEDVPDPVFSEKMMGDGIAIYPSSNEVLSPFDCEVVMVMKETKHAIGLKSKEGIEILIHVGLETMTLNGEGFELHVQEGDVVNKGDKLISIDRALLKEKEFTDLTMLVITNMQDFHIEEYNTNKVVTYDDTILRLQRTCNALKL